MEDIFYDNPISSQNTFIFDILHAQHEREWRHTDRTRGSQKYDRVRLETFQSSHSWPPNAKVEAWKMARAGLRYMGEGEEVQCSWCGVVLGDWQYGDQRHAEHVAEA